ncbi:hypothetical protein OAM79_04290 [Litorivicinus sp.]|nr:hypothetical protein [Litorivicinus sp.]
MKVPDARKVKLPAGANARLKKLLTEQMLDNAMLRNVNSKSGDARGQT